MNLTSQDKDKISSYLRKGLLDKYLTDEEKEVLIEKHPMAEGYVLSSEEWGRFERSCMKYEEIAFLKISNQYTSRDIRLKIEDDNINLEMELKEFLISQGITIKRFRQNSQFI